MILKQYQGINSEGKELVAYICRSSTSEHRVLQTQLAATESIQYYLLRPSFVTFKPSPSLIAFKHRRRAEESPLVNAIRSNLN